MNTLVFHNPGEIDIRGACIAGLSAKDIDSPIGYFGTGLKYAIACILRWDGEITIYSGTTEYKFTKGTIDYRGEQFSQIYMNDQPLGFTTEYGKNWKAWQVFRELYANARDELGDVEIFQGDLQVAEGRTVIFVSGVPELINSYYERHEIILPANMIWDYQEARVQMRAIKAKGIYYRGVNVHDQPSFYTWNFLSDLTLTEDRTLNNIIQIDYYFSNFIEESLHDIDILMELLRMKFDNYNPQLSKVIERDGEPVRVDATSMEHFAMSWFTMPDYATARHSEEFKQAAVRLYQRDPTTYAKMRSFVKSVDASAVKSRLHILNVREQMMFDKAKQLVSMFGFNEEIERLEVHIQDLGGSTLGLYENGTIYLSPKLFDQGTKQLVATLYEECYHHRTKEKDCTYNMQTDLFNIIISLNEEIHGVVC
jgi:hypothetical protein